MKKTESILYGSEELQWLVSALAKAQNVSESEITIDDINAFCNQCGFDLPPIVTVYELIPVG